MEYREDNERWLAAPIEERRDTPANKDERNELYDQPPDDASGEPKERNRTTRS